MKQIVTLTMLLAVSICTAQSPTPPNEANIKNLQTAATKAWEAQKWSEAVPAYRALLEQTPDDGRAWHHLGYALHALGRLEEALGVHKKASEFEGVGHIAAYNVACVYALKDKKDLAFEWIEKAVKKGFRGVDYLKEDPDLDSIRSDPRFEAIVKKVSSMPATEKFRVFGSGGTSDRKEARILYWGDSGGPLGQLFINFGPVPWKANYAGLLDSEKFLNRRWRLGGNSWTRLDTDLPLKVGDKKLDPGQYYMTLEHKGEGKLLLAFLDPDSVRRKHLDPYLAHHTKGGTEVEMKLETSKEIAKDLSIVLHSNKEKGTKLKLEISFGPHRLSCPISVQFAPHTP